MENLADIQLAFIDGAHRFPLPQVDFHYIEPGIVVGGLLAVDDCDMPSVKVLCDFLGRRAGAANKSVLARPVAQVRSA
jgi:hypothetical protein